MKEFQIIAFSAEYQKEVHDFLLNILEKEMGFLGYERPDLENISEAYQGDSSSHFWIALDEGEVVGTIGLLGKSDELAYIKRLAVKKELRKKGLGGQLLNILLQFAKKHGYKKVFAGTVKENQNAIHFYQKNGFELSKQIPEGIIAGGDSVCLEFKAQ